MKKILLLVIALLALVGNSQAQKYVGTFYGAALGISNAPVNIATNGAAAANGTILQKTGDKLQFTATVTNLNIGTAIVNQIYGPYTNLAGWFDSSGKLIGTNSLTLNSTSNTLVMKARDSIAETNYFGASSDGKITAVGGVMYIQQGAGNAYVFGQSSPTGDGHVSAGDFTGSGDTLTFQNGAKPLSNVVENASGVYTKTNLFVTNTLFVATSAGTRVAAIEVNGAGAMLLNVSSGDGIVAYGILEPSANGGDLGNTADGKRWDGFFVNTITTGFSQVTNGTASFATTTAVAITATGWTNIWSTNNATVYVTATAVAWTIKNRANATIYTSPTLTATVPVTLQPGWSVNAASGLAGTALPW